MKPTRKSLTSVVCADKLRVLADVTRLSVMETLLDGPKNVTEINARIKIDQSLLSHHLKVLREAGLVTSRREGKAVRYTIAPEAASLGAGKGINLGCCQISFVQFGSKK
jgi:DNA-binding transcriptional ArsR family regulator